MKTTVKSPSLVLAALFAVSLCSCGYSGDPGTEKSTDTQSYSQPDITTVAGTTEAARESLPADTTGSAEPPADKPYVTVAAEANPDYPNLPAGNDTEDRVFVLNVQEAGRYFSDDAARMCAPTAAVLAANSVYAHTGKKAWYSDQDYLCGRWLRSPALFRVLYVSVVSSRGKFSSGQVYVSGTATTGIDTCVRTAMWINAG